MSEFDETFDFIVVGSGGGSMCAGLVMRQAGRSCLILEKTVKVGGSTAKSGGVMWIPNNRFMAEDGVADSHAAATAYLDAVVGDHDDTPGATRERRETYLRQAPEMLDFLIAQGIDLRRNLSWPDYYYEQPGGNAPGRTVSAELFDVNQLGPWRDRLRAGALQLQSPMHEALLLPLFKVSWAGKRAMAKTVLRTIGAKLTGKRYVTSGEALQGRMLQAALKAEVDIRTDAPVSEIIIERGVATGVVTVKDGRPWRVGARLGILLNAGGFAHNQEMRDKYMPRTQAKWSQAAPGDTGDMHRELMRIGAAMAQMEEMVGNQMTVPPDREPQYVQMQLTKPHAFMVDQSGERYMNECGSYMMFCKKMLERDRVSPALPSWMIMDTQFLRRYLLGDTMPGTRKPKSWLETGYMRKADTIEELARACDIDPARLATSLERFNRFARQGRDEDFQRGDRAYDRWLGDFTHGPSQTLGTVEKAPFYAVPIVPGDVGTYGGVVTDTAARVLREDGSMIPGLYATGTTTASVMGRVYPGAGCSVGPSFTFGFIAARHALRLNEPSSIAA